MKVAVVDLERCQEPRLLTRALSQMVEATARAFRDAEWTLRVERDPEYRRTLLVELENAELALARLRGLVVAPPAELVDAALNREALRLCDEVLDRLRAVHV